MMRHALSMLGGIALAVGLFWMLALLVAPPEQQVDEPIMTMSMTMVEAPEVAPEQEAPPPAPAQAAPAPPPMPTPAPAPVATSTIALPEVELPDAPVEPVELESELPELTEAQPKPTPRPQPAPEPAPEPSPEPAETAAPPAEPAAAQRDAAPAAEPAPSNEPVSVGQVAPTNRVNPSYPPRAQRRGMEGFVEVEFVIQRNGSVDGSSIRVTNAQPRRVFEDAAR